jgi:formylglycine-generating enzyme required for sulfatase activity
VNVNPLRIVAPLLWLLLADGPAQLKALDIIENSIGVKLVLVPSGNYMMGSPPGEKFRQEEEVQHKVTLSRPFRIGMTEITQQQWDFVMGSNHSEHQGGNLPVERVSWLNATEYCRKLSEKEGKKYRLPTEAEWEYACRSGSTGAFGGSEDLETMGWHAENSEGLTHPVASLKANAWGIFDLQGNVAEWCSDYYLAGYGSGEMTDPRGPAEGKGRVVRGGSFDYFPAGCRCAARSSARESYQLNRIGFRIVQDE